MTDLATLAEMEHDDPEFVPEIVSVDARLSIKGSKDRLMELFQRVAALTKDSTHALLDAVPATRAAVAHARLTGSDTTQVISVVQDGLTVIMPGSALIPAQRIYNIMKLAPTDNLSIEVVGTAAVIRSGRALWSVQSLVEDPLSASLSAALDVRAIPTQSVPVRAFVSALSAARSAVSATSAWLGLNQLLIKNGTVTGCDGGRLHRMELRGVDPSLHFTIPLTVVDEALKALRATKAETFELGYSQRLIVLHVEQDTIVAKRLLADYPQIENLLLGPAFSNTNLLTMNRKQLLEAIKRVRINADPDRSGITLQLVPGKQAADGLTWSLGLHARDRAGNTSSEAIDASYSGSERQRPVTVNHRFLTTFLEAYEAEEVTFKLGDGTKTQPAPILVEDLEAGFSGIIQQMYS